MAQTEFLDETNINQRISTLLYRLLSQGKTEEAIKWVDAAVEDGLALTFASRYYATAGAKKKSLDLLEEAVRQRIPQVLVGQTHAPFDPYRSDPRFIQIRRTIGLEP